MLEAFEEFIEMLASEEFLERELDRGRWRGGNLGNLFSFDFRLGLFSLSCDGGLSSVVWEACWLPFLVGSGGFLLMSLSVSISI